MKTVLIALALALALLGPACGMALAGEPPARRPVELGYGKRKAEGVERPQPCAAQGPGFRAAGEGACLRVFGGVRYEMTSRRTDR